LQSPALLETLNRAAELFHWGADPEPPPFDNPPEGRLKVGVDLGTAYLTVAVLNEQDQPVTGEYQFAQVARDGLVVDFVGAVDLVRSMIDRIERRIGRELTHAASGYPPGVPGVEVQSTAFVVEAADMICIGLVDEPTAANALVKLENGVIVDVGGGTTGIAVVENGQVVYTADEATGGTHFSLVIAGAHDIQLEDAETMKVDPAQQPVLFPVIKPVLEKVASIVARHIEGFQVPEIALVGGTSAFYRAAEVIEEYTGIPTWVPPHPALVTPIGMAINNNPED
jgi:ethanolamine utilization protein EutJ